VAHTDGQYSLRATLTDRVSPEAPIPVLRFRREENRLGGAGFVLAGLATLGARVAAVLAPANAWPYSLHVLRPAIAATVVPNTGHWLLLDAPDRFGAALSAALDAV